MNAQELVKVIDGILAEISQTSYQPRIDLVRDALTYLLVYVWPEGKYGKLSVTRAIINALGDLADYQVTGEKGDLITARVNILAVRNYLSRKIHK